MKIGLPVTSGALSAKVADKMGTAAYLMVVDTDDMSFEVVARPPESIGPGAGIQAITLLLGMDAQVLLAGYIAPHIIDSLKKNGISVITGVNGCVRDAVEQYRCDNFSSSNMTSIKTDTTIFSATGNGREAVQKALKQFYTMLPILIGVILVIGLFQTFLPPKFLMTLFSGNALKDTVFGACAGSILAGNPINSYVIGQTLLKIGVSLFGVCALMVSWVSIGLVQLPVEISALGARFAVVRNAAAFVVSILAALLIVWLSGGIP